jgi:hypothetical protein
MNNYDRAVLAAIAKGPEPVAWYRIEQPLSVTELEMRESLPESLHELTVAGLIEEALDEPGGKITAGARQADGEA